MSHYLRIHTHVLPVSTVVVCARKLPRGQMMKEVTASSPRRPPALCLPTGEGGPSWFIYPLQVEQISRRSDHHFSRDARVRASAFDRRFSLWPACDRWLIRKVRSIVDGI